MALALASSSRLATRSAIFNVAARSFHSGRVNAVQRSEQAKADAYAYVPGGPILKGDVNQATTFPPPSASHGSYHWSFERLLSASLIPLTASAAVVSGSAYPVVDGLLGISLIVHSHIGFDSCFEDYLHPRKFPILGVVVKWGLRAATTGALVGVYAFNTQDIGLTELVKRVWTA